MKVLLACACFALAVLNVFLALDDDGFEASVEKDGPAVEAAALAAVTTSDPVNCRILYTDDLLEQTSGLTGAAAMEACEARESEDPEVEISGQVTLGEFQDGSAEAFVLIEGGGGLDGAISHLQLTYEYGLWRVNRFVSVDVDRDAFDRALREELIESPLAVREADCIVEAWREIPEDELEAAMVEAVGAPEQLDTDKTFGCVSPETKRRMLAQIVADAGETQAQDEDTIACVSGRMMRLPPKVAARILGDMGGEEAERTINAAIASCRAQEQSLRET